MEASKKKPIMLGIIVVCLAVAGAVTYMSRPKKHSLDVFKDETVWVKCRNPGCEHEWQMNKKEYFEYMEEHGNPASPLPPPLVCPKCGEEGGYRAVKCAKCGLVFETGSVPATFSDTCPDCGYSKIKEDRKKAAEARRGK